MKSRRKSKITREKLIARKEGEMKAILKSFPEMNFRMKKDTKDKKAISRPYVTKTNRDNCPKK